VSITLLRLNGPCRDSLQDGGREGLPALLRVGVRLVGSNSQASVQPQYTLLSDFGEITE